MGCTATEVSFSAHEPPPLALYGCPNINATMDDSGTMWYCAQHTSLGVSPVPVHGVDDACAMCKASDSACAIRVLDDAHDPGQPASLLTERCWPIDRWHMVAYGNEVDEVDDVDEVNEVNITTSAVYDPTYGTRVLPFLHMLRRCRMFWENEHGGNNITMWEDTETGMVHMNDETYGDAPNCILGAFLSRGVALDAWADFCEAFAEDARAFDFFFLVGAGKGGRRNLSQQSEAWVVRWGICTKTNHIIRGDDISAAEEGLPLKAFEQEVRRSNGLIPLATRPVCDVAVAAS